MMMKRLFLTACLSVLTAGCAAQATTPASKACVAPGTWYDPARNTNLSNADVLNRIEDLDVVLLGETHTDQDHHLWQLQTIAQLYAKRPNLVLGFEAFPRRVQGVLDQWVAGKLSEAEFLKQSDWNTVWKFDPKLYMGLFHFARINHVPMIALNVDKSLTKKVSNMGWKAVPKDQRLGLSDPIAPSQAYLNMLEHVYGLHDNGKGKDKPDLKDDPRFAGFVDVQVTWDRAMAEAIAGALQKEVPPQVVTIVGRGHVEYGYGIPHQLSHLGIEKVSVLTPWEDVRPCSDLKDESGKTVANAVFGLTLAQDAQAAPKPKLGVMIAPAKDGGVHISGVLKTSVGDVSGLLKDDIITMAAGQPVNTTEELVRIIQSISPGMWLPLTIKRGEETKDLIARFPAKPTQKKHP